MSDQLALLAEEPAPLTPRQLEALDHLRRAGSDGLTAHELGVLLYGDRPETRSWGNSAGQALRRKGLAAQRGRNRVWVALTEPDQGAGHSAHPGETASAPGSVSAVPPDGLPEFNSMPENY